MQDTYLVMGMKRSGHHAVMEWVNSLLYQPTRTFQFDNNIKIHEPSLEWERPKTDIYMFNLEDYKLHYAKLMTDRHLGSGSYKQAKKIVVIRDHYNLYASRYKKKIKATVGIRAGWMTEMSKWIYFNHCKAIKKDAYTVILFNEWFKSREYRKKKAKELGFKNIKNERINKI